MTNIDGFATVGDDEVRAADEQAVTAWRHMSEGELAIAEDALTAAASIVDIALDATLRRQPRCLYRVARAEMAAGRLFDAHRHLSRAIALGQRHRTWASQLPLLAALGEVQFRLGHLCEARVTLDAADHEAASEATEAHRFLAVAFRAQTLLWLEKTPDAAVELADQLVVRCPDRPWSQSVIAIAAGIMISGGCGVRGRRLMLAAGGGPELRRLPAWRRVEMWESLTTDAFAAGSYPVAAHFARLARGSVARWPSVGQLALVARIDLRDRGTDGDLVGTTRLATGAFATTGQLLEQARTELTAATAGIRAGWSHQADRAAWVRERLANAADLARMTGSQQLVASVGAEMRRFGGGGERELPLTPREWQIGRLVATGLTSAAIGARTGLSPRTVDNHLGRMYRKLRVPSRASLTRLILQYEQRTATAPVESP